MDRPVDAPEKARGAQKTARIPIKIVPQGTTAQTRVDRVRLAGGEEAERFQSIKATLRAHRLHTVCEEASCPNTPHSSASARARPPS